MGLREFYRGSYQAIYDLERVEVIKGPQATLFGTASAVACGNS